MLLPFLENEKKSILLLNQALDAHRAALTLLTRERKPLAWATTQHNLGVTLIALGRLKRAPTLLEQAADALKVALHEQTRERTPIDWAATQNTLGLAFMNLGELRQSRDDFEHARRAYEEALEVLGNLEAPRHREMAESNLEEVTHRLRQLPRSPRAQ